MKFQSYIIDSFKRREHSLFDKKNFYVICLGTSNFFRKAALPYDYSEELQFQKTLFATLMFLLEPLFAETPKTELSVLIDSLSEESLKTSSFLSIKNFFFYLANEFYKPLKD